MKFLFNVLFATSLTLGAGAFACPVGTVCPGDNVYPDDYSAGYAQVIAINTSTSVVTVMGNNSSTYDRYSMSQLALPQGCIGRICVGSQVIPQDFSGGFATVIAINSSEGKITVMGNNSSTYDRYTADQVGVEQGCIAGICVGDEVFPDDYSAGYATVTSINSANQQITVKGNNSSTYDRYTATHLSITKVCETYGNERSQN